MIKRDANTTSKSSFFLNNFFSSLTNKKVFIILFSLGLILFFNTFFNNFVWDDNGQIVHNESVHSILNIPRFFEGGTFTPGNTIDKGSGDYYKPLMSTFFSFIYTIFGQHAIFFHLFQVCLHILNAMMLFLLFSSFFNKKLSLFLACMFLSHPVNTETVAYISALQDILFFFFGMAVFMIVLKDNKSERHISYVTLLISFALLLCSLLSKESGFLFILILPVFLYLFKRKKVILYSTISLLSFLSYLYFRFGIGHHSVSAPMNIPIAKASLSIRLLNIPKIIFSYLKNFVFPTHLSVGQMWIVTSPNMQNFYIPLLVIVLFFSLLLFFGVWIISQKNKLFTKSYFFFLIWFLFGIGIHLQIFPLDMTFADRWFYFPMAGLLGLIGLGVTNFHSYNSHIQSIFKIFGIIIIVIFCMRTFVRNSNWNSNYSLFSHDIVIDNDNFYLQNKLGSELVFVNKLDEAKKHYLSSVRLYSNASAYSNLGIVSLKMKKFEDAEQYFIHAIRKDRMYYPSYQNLAYTFLKENKPRQAIEIIEQSLRISPNNDQLWILLTFAEYKLGNKKKATESIKHAHTLSPSPYTEMIYPFAMIL